MNPKNEVVTIRCKHLVELFYEYNVVENQDLWPRKKADIGQDEIKVSTSTKYTLYTLRM